MFNGRIDRLGYLLGLVYCGGAVFIASVFLFLFNSLAGNTSQTRDTLYVFLLILIVGYIVLSTGLAIRRWHDLGYSGWFSLLLYAPLVGNFVSLWLLFIRGNQAANSYGDPLHPRDFDRVLFGPRPADAAPKSKN